MLRSTSFPYSKTLGYLSLAVFFTFAFGQPASAEKSCPLLDSGVEFGSSLFSLAEKCVFAPGIHRIELKVAKQAEDWIHTQAAAKVKDRDFARVLEVCFFEKIDSAKPTRCVRDAAFRVRGNSTLRRSKHQYTIHFAPEDKGIVEAPDLPWQAPAPSPAGRPFGMRALNLRSGGYSTKDLSMLREALAARSFTQLMPAPARGGLVPRTAKYKLEVRHCLPGADGPEDCGRRLNRGIYDLVEEIDENFIRTRFEQSNEGIAGALYATGYASLGEKADFYDDRFGPSAYAPRGYFKSSIFKAPPAALRPHLERCEAKWGGLPKPKGDKKRALIWACAQLALMNQFIDANDLNELRKMISLDSAYAYMFAVSFSGHWDSVLGNANNDFLYFRADPAAPYGGTWFVLPWDLDHTFGVSAPQQAEAPYDQFASRTDNRLFTFLLQHPEAKIEYAAKSRALLASLSEPMILAAVKTESDDLASARRGTWEEKRGVDYPAATSGLLKFLTDRFRALRTSLNP